MDKLHTTINRRIATLKRAEGTIKEQLGLVSRELLEHFDAHGDGTLSVRTLGVLTPANQSVAQKFFDTFIFVDDKGAKRGNKKRRSVTDEARKAFLETDGDIWTWAADNIVVEVKPVDLKKNLTHALKQAVEGINTEKRQAEAMEPTMMVRAILDVVPVDIFLALIEQDAVKEVA